MSKHQLPNIPNWAKYARLKCNIPAKEANKKILALAWLPEAGIINSIHYTRMFKANNALTLKIFIT